MENTWPLKLNPIITPSPFYRGKGLDSKITGSLNGEQMGGGAIYAFYL